MCACSYWFLWDVFVNRSRLSLSVKCCRRRLTALWRQASPEDRGGEEREICPEETWNNCKLSNSEFRRNSTAAKNVIYFFKLLFLSFFLPSYLTENLIQKVFRIFASLRWVIRNKKSPWIPLNTFFVLFLSFKKKTTVVRVNNMVQRWKKPRNRLNYSLVLLYSIWFEEQFIFFSFPSSVLFYIRYFPV